MNHHNDYDTEAMRLAAPGPASDDDASPELQGEQRDLDDLCERWVEWTRTRRYYGPAAELLIFAKNMTTAELLVRYVFRLVPGEYGHGAKAIERGSEEAVACWANAAKGQGLRRGGAGRWRGTPDRVHVEGIA